MATKLKTTFFALPMYTGIITDAVDTLIGTGSLYFPENTPSTPITIKSLTVDIGFQDVITATGGTITENRVSLKLGTAASSSIVELDDIANSGEQLGGVLAPWDFTSYAQSNIGTAASQSYAINVFFDQNTGTTLGMTNVNALVYLTYEYDDTSTTQIKTIPIPFESSNTFLPSTETELGTNQIPALNTYLKENDKVIRDYFFVIEGNSNGGGSTVDFVVSSKIDSETQYDTGLNEKGLASSIFTRWIWSRTNDYPDTGSVHALKAWTADGVTAYHSIAYTLFVTYEFNASTSTEATNAIFIPMELGSPLGLDTAPSRFQRDVMIQEPEPIALLHSAFRFQYNAANTITGLNIRMGNQSYRNYVTAASTVCGMLTHQQRIDAGSVMGAYGTFARGRNTFTFDAYRTDTTNDPTNLNGYILLNYSSGIASEGISSHSHTVFQNLYQWDALLSDRLIVGPFSLTIPEEKHWINSIGVISIIWDSVAGNAFIMDVEVKPGEGKGLGYIDLYADAVQSDAEKRCSIVWMRGRDAFQRYPGDVDTERIDVETSRLYRFFTPTTTAQGLYFFMTYHGISYPITGSVSNYSGTGEGISVDVFRTFDDAKILRLTTDVSGSFSGSWYDNTEEIYCVVREDNNHVGRSRNGVLS